LTPLRDSFEDAKAAAWSKLGERVLRVDVSELPSISATATREALKDGGSVTDFLAPRTVEILEESGYLDVLRQLG
jgi:hypothetical protein